MATSLYVLTSSTRNVTILLEFFSQYIFAFISAGNMTPYMFFFIVYFISFVKINQFYDSKNGLKLKDYGVLYAYRVLKIAPLYYFVFLAGWALVPVLSTSINWYVADRLFEGCSSQWYLVMTFLNTYIPFFTKALAGCFYWPFLIPNDLQLFLIFPIWIITYR